ncbi:ROK family protein [Faecalibaculum rodentium]|jgi:predicted NBD/HSP70 family sugar kinase|uniref:ROK family protein n=1 Tax=Faecalibaculum rodentium TaxID=1702221 RepID=UPI001C3D23C3|nr:ROK family protein [Faecalibaculum rodentium]
MNRYIAIDIGGTAIKHGLLDQEGRILEQGELPTPTDSLESFLRTLQQILALYDGKEPCGIAVAAPGKIDTERCYFHTGGALAYLQGVDFREAVSELTDLPVTLVNDAKAAALAELWKGALSDAESGIVITLGTGIGGAVIANGKLINGFTGAAGEFSPIPVHWDSRVTGLGNSFTDMNCTRAMLDRYAARTRREPGSVDGRMFFGQIRNHDSAALEELSAFCQTLANAVLAFQLILDSEKVLIGGGISRQPVLIDTLRREVHDLFGRLPDGHPASEPVIDACSFSSDANLAGALYHHLTQTDSLNPETGN